MSKRDELITKYADDLKNKLKVTPDMDLLTKVTIGCGPSIYNRDSSTVSGSDESELATVKNNFLIKKLGLSDSAALDEGIAKVMDQYGSSERNKYRGCLQLKKYIFKLKTVLLRNGFFITRLPTLQSDFLLQFITITFVGYDSIREIQYS